MKFQTPPKKNPNFCLAPWTHTFISPQSERRLCCASREIPSYVQQYIDQDGGDMTEKVYRPVSLDAHWNSDYMKGIRLKMMAGENVPECEVCQSQRLHINTYRDYFTKHLYPHLLNEVESHTTTDGSTDWRPRSFDYRFSNACGFKCRMCGEQLSSAWETEKRQFGMWSPASNPWMESSIREEITRFTEDVVEKEFNDALVRGDIEEIYWVGGEPLIWPKHWETMSRLVQTGDARKVHVRYNTNLGNIDWRGKNLFHDILPHFKSYQVCASIDAAGDVGEWIRTGLDWNRWIENFKTGIEYQKSRGYDSIIADITLTLPGLLGMKDLFDLLIELDAKTYVKMVFAFDSEKVLSPFVLPRPLLESTVDDLLEYMEPRATDRQAQLIDTLKEIRRRPTFEETWPDSWKEGFVKGRKWMRDLGQIRGDGKNGKISLEEILGRKPDLLEWWEGVKL